MSTTCHTCNHPRIVHKNDKEKCTITDCQCEAFVVDPESPLPRFIETLAGPDAYLATAAVICGMRMDKSENPTELAGLANLGNYLWFRLQQRNCKTLIAGGDKDLELMEKKHEAECTKYKALLPKEWQW